MFFLETRLLFFWWSIIRFVVLSCNLWIPLQKPCKLLIFGVLLMIWVSISSLLLELVWYDIPCSMLYVWDHKIINKSIFFWYDSSMAYITSIKKKLDFKRWRLPIIFTTFKYEANIKKLLAHPYSYERVQFLVVFSEFKIWISALLW